jgi:penicillin-insensitive murein endopeptidase
MTRRGLRPLAFPLAVTLFVADAAATEPAWWDAPAPTAGPPQVIGRPALGCIAGAVALPPDGPGYQAMRLSRRRTFGHPQLIGFVHALAESAQALGWHGILVGDLAQPRGGPMRSGHRSHQSGIDVDVWFTPAPARPLSLEERETLAAESVVAADGRSLVPERWTASHARLLKAAAEHPLTERIFVHAAIKKALCESAGSDRRWLAKLRPWWGHDAHFHVRLFCPSGDGACEPGEPLPPGDGCDASLDWWFSEEAMAELRRPRPPARPLTLDDLPAACRDVLLGG